MSKISPETLRPLWERALSAECGIAIACTDPQALRHLLLTTRKDLNTPEFDEVMTFLPEGKGEVFMVRRSVELPDA